MVFCRIALKGAFLSGVKRLELRTATMETLVFRRIPSAAGCHRTTNIHHGKALQGLLSSFRPLPACSVSRICEALATRDFIQHCHLSGETAFGLLILKSQSMIQ